MNQCQLCYRFSSAVDDNGVCEKCGGEGNTAYLIRYKEEEKDGLHRRRDSRESRTVYLMRAANGLYKIGYAKNVDRRLVEVNANSPIPVEIIHTIEHPGYRTVEKHLHKLFGERRVRGEWFDLDESQVDWFLALDTAQIIRIIRIEEFDENPNLAAVTWGAL